MQISTPIFDDSSAGLVERVRDNRLTLEATALRLSAARSLTEQRLDQTLRLLADVRLAIAVLREHPTGTVPDLRPARPAASLLFLLRSGSAPADPLDVVRQKLHAEYAATADPAIRADLLSSYDGFARSLALKYRHRESVDDLVQVARIGLLHAIDRFDPSLGRPFPLFARITIIGELKRHLRDRTWGMRVPRSLQEDYLTVMRAVDELTAERSDSPSVAVVAARCGISLERVVEAMELRITQRALSIDVPTGAGSGDPVIELSQEDGGFRQLEDREFLAALLDRLPARDRRIIELRFIEELTQAEIAARIGVSQMCVSRVLARTLGRLRGWARTAV